MISEHNIAGLIGATVTDPEGEKVGKVGQIFVDPANGRPNWATVKTGFFGNSESFVPLERADAVDGDVRVPFSKDVVKGAPRISSDDALSSSEEDELYDYYHGVGGSSDAGRGGVADDASSDLDAESAASGVRSRATDTNDTGADPEAQPTNAGAANVDTAGGRDTSGATTDDAMTRSEEHLRVGTERVQTGRARLRKYIVTEHETVTVPVQREEVVLEREPITDANAGAALDGPAISEEEHEVTLSEERPVVEKEAVPVERVRLGTETVSDTDTVSADVRKEEIELEGDGRTNDR